MKSIFLHLIIVIILLFVIVDNEPIRSFIFDVKTDKVVVIDQGRKYKSQFAKVSHIYKGKEYIREIHLDTNFYKFYNTGDSMKISYLKDKPDDAIYHKGLPIYFLAALILGLTIFMSTLFIKIYHYFKK
ncbi:hypothetical protein WAF17_07750 [Bernardetia sp. ABR2-2B]|uniref:hypothetical protein n=1 Tax=Bernardetia sp. ABR2-2B TaxID=3127472 RepID=UPI0030CFC14F